MKLTNNPLVMLMTAREVHSHDHWPDSGTITAEEFGSQEDEKKKLCGIIWGTGTPYGINRDLVRVVRVTPHAHNALMPHSNIYHFRSGEIVFVGKGADAADYIYNHGGAHLPLTFRAVDSTMRADAIGGDECVLSGGDSSFFKAYDYSRLRGTSECVLVGRDGCDFVGSGLHNTIVGGNRCTADGGMFSVITLRGRARVVAGDCSSVTVGNGKVETGADCVVHSRGGMFKVGKGTVVHVRKQFGYATGVAGSEDMPAGVWVAFDGKFVEVTDDQSAQAE